MFGWSTSISAALICIFCLHSYWPVNINCIVENCYDTSISVLYAILIKLIWSLSMSWIILACVTNKSGFINSVLSRPMFKSLFKLTFMMYLIHYQIGTFWHCQAKIPFHFDKYQLVYHFWGNFCMILVCSLILHLLIEKPLTSLIKLLLNNQKVDQEPKYHEI